MRQALTSARRCRTGRPSARWHLPGGQRRGGRPPSRGQMLSGVRGAVSLNPTPSVARASALTRRARFSDLRGNLQIYRLLIDAMKVAKNRGAFLLPEARKRRTFSAGPRTVLRSEPSRRECVALARLARQPVPHAVSLARSSRKQRGQSCISHDARRAPRRRTVAGSGAQRCIVAA